jgi:branched-chain amino acid transport system permease protein
MSLRRMGRQECLPHRIATFLVTEFIQQLVNGLSVGSIYALIAVGYTMVYGVLQLINFAHGDVFMVGAMVGLYAATGQVPPTFPWWLHATIIAGLLLALLIYRLKGRSWRITLGKLVPLAAIYVLAVPGLLLASIVSKRLSLPTWTATIFVLIVTVTLCGVLGYVIERLAYRPLRNKPRINSLITAIGVSLLLEYGGQNPNVFGATPQPFPSGLVPGIKGALISSHHVVIDRVDALVLGLTLAIMIGLTFIVLKTRTGLALRAVSYRFDTASLMGVNIDRTISFTFVLGSCLAAVAGLLYAIKYPSIDPLMGLLPGIKAFVAAVFGGIGNIAGAVIGALVLGLIEAMVVGYLPGGSQYRDGVAFVILIAILLVKPSGLLGRNVVEKV